MLKLTAGAGWGTAPAPHIEQTLRYLTMACSSFCLRVSRHTICKQAGLYWSGIEQSFVVFELSGQIAQLCGNIA